MSKVTAILLLGIATIRVIGQEPAYPDLVKDESSLQMLFERLYGDTLQDPQPILDSIAIMMPEVLVKPGAMEFSWKGLNRIGVITSDDDRIRIFTCCRFHLIRIK